MDAGYFFEALIVFLVLGPVPGILIGYQKGQLISGIVWTLLLGPLGLIILLCLPNKNREALEEQKMALLRQQVDLQRKQLEVQKAASAPPPPKRASSGQEIRIAKDGTDWGMMKFNEVRALLSSGDLTMEDHYFDSELNQWVTLNCHPELVDLQA